jgi:hypothetical protein
MNKLTGIGLLLMCASAQQASAQTTYPVSTINAVGQAAPVVVKKAPPLGLVATLSAGAVLTYSVQVTADPFPSSTGNWNNHDYLAALTVSANGNVLYPITGIRLVVTAYTSGSISLGIAQWP